MSHEPALPAESFPEFYHSVYNCQPFRWQVRLAERACEGDWPRFIKLPTASGKTSCIDIAVFALAHQAWRRHCTGAVIEAPRRIFFVVDRRIIVNEAYKRATALAKRLDTTETDSPGALHAVAWWLRDLAGNQIAPPLDCFELRGGIYRDDAWVRSLLQPTVLTSTVDQVGSRLLFRGYGVSDRNLPIHAALTANDSLILLDEAHCSNPFSQTMTAIARYRDAGLATDSAPRWAEQALRTPFRFVEMTATPRSTDSKDIFTLNDADYEADKPLATRHRCEKPIHLEQSNAKGAKQNLTLAKHLVEQAESLAQGTADRPRCLRIAIVVNRVQCARRAFELLRNKYGERVELMIGRMRPIDRDRLTETLQGRFKSNSEESLTEPHFVIATQCLEVGADMDFDGMVCQCASLDALRQRFGRLNRLGQSAHARGVIVMAEGDIAPRKPDPIYAESLSATWDWLQRQAQESEVDFGVRSLDAVIEKNRAEDAQAVKRLSAPQVDGPVLMPAHLDLLCQTAPRPALEPDVSAYLHGAKRGVPEVRVCWRADLPPFQGRQKTEWLDECQQTLAVVPPSSAECLSVPLPQFKAWLQGDDDGEADDNGDMLGEEIAEEDDTTQSKKPKQKIPAHRRGVTWNGRTCLAASARTDEFTSVRPNALIVLPAMAGGWATLGYVPNAPAEPDVAASTGKSAEPAADESRSFARIDEASAAFERARDRVILRVHPSLVTCDADLAALKGLWDYIDDPNLGWQHRALGIDDEADAIGPTTESASSQEVGRSIELLEARRSLNRSARQVRMVRYPGGIALTGPRITPRAKLPRASFDDDFDEHNVDAEGRISLAEHLADVTIEVERLASNISLDPMLASALVSAAERHDLGKADLRFQAMLLASSLDMAAMQPKLWAKSACGTAVSQGAGEPSRSKMGADQLPYGFRHEMLSLELARQIRDDLDPESREVMLHAIAAHHGHARPFAPVVIDDAPPDVDLSNLFPHGATEFNVLLTSEERRMCPPHRLDTGISERFWKLNRRFGWWGLAWLESALRLADWVASAQLAGRSLEPRILRRATDVPPTVPTALHFLNCVGLNGANPLGFLAALGLFRHLATELDPNMRLRWEVAGGNWSPTLIGTHPVLASEAAMLDRLVETLKKDPSQHWLKTLNEIPDEQLGLCRVESRYARAAEAAAVTDRAEADWLSCNGSDLCEAAMNNQLQTARRDYFPESAVAIISAVTRTHLERTLFRQWDYDDPIQKVSLHLEPREDRRHAYQWHKPVGDPTRSLRGGMVAANRLAMEAWPLFQSVAVRAGLQTVGFQGTRPVRGIVWTWPLWAVPLGLWDVTPVLNLDELQSGLGEARLDGCAALRERSIPTAFRLRRILVEKTPNFTPAIALFTGSIAKHRVDANRGIV